MYRDPSEFRERFKAYKDGKSVREIYGLPGYYDGKEAEEVSDDTYRFIRKHEGFAKTLTPDPGNGQMFIGSGLSGKKYIDAFKAKGVWTEVDNTRAIKEVVRQNRSYIRAIFGERYNHLTDDQKKVIDDIAFNIGVGNLTKEKAPKFVAAVLAGDDVTAKKEINWGDKQKDIYGNPLIGVQNRNIERRMLWGGRNNMPEWKAPHIISKPDVTRVATTIPQQKTIPIADPRNATIAEAQRAMWAHNVMEDMKGAYQVPVWEFPSLPALTPVGYDVTPMRYKNGKLPGYRIGKNPSHAKMNEDGIFTDDYTKVFEDMYVTPDKVDLKRGSHTLNNFPEYLANRTAWMQTFMPQSVLNDKPLEQPAIDPFLLLITGGRFSGDLTGDVIGMGLDKAQKIAINSAANAARVAAKTPVGKRTVETIMRTSSNPTPFDKIKNGVKTFDKNRSKAVLNYILTGKRTGNFGYYNSFAETPEQAYTGFVSERLKKYAQDLDEANIMLHNPNSEYGDAIDAYLYNKQIDPVYGFDLVSVGNDFGPHGQYILQNYNKVSKNIPVYESPVQTIEIRIPRSQTSQVKSIENIGDEGYIRGAYSNKGNVEYDAAGHLKQLGTFANVPVAREQDIWKYLPSDYNKYTTDLKGVRKVLQYIGTNAVDAAGTPIIVRTPWQYYPNYSSEFINKIAGYKDGKIAIKPANRGKFNATKKRTGKTTEELTHSKNPLTRKRAIFAQNARKWHHADGKLPSYEDGRPRITTGGAGVTSVYQPAPNSPEVQPTVDLLERIANFLPYVGTIQDWEQVTNGNIGKVPSAMIGTVADIFLPGLRSSYKAAKAYEAASKAAPRLVDKIKYYKASQKAYKKTAANVGYQVAGTYEDILDDQGYQFPLFINK